MRGLASCAAACARPMKTETQSTARAPRERPRIGENPFVRRHIPGGLRRNPCRMIRHAGGKTIKECPGTRGGWKELVADANDLETACAAGDAAEFAFGAHHIVAVDDDALALQLVGGILEHVVRVGVHDVEGHRIYA